ncbi:helix-turn-helix transcriptional regulator [Amycolatopsis sp. CA-230715]|uniref:helix-turn-helix transcriptional regulator n=1 Tax=Amycolatopsis sp. CA-230715 TaxID=2745196 RepID=UPI001C01C4DF|nr:helix-turn-helix transcriptional regulator [Amycolatopsis sp. CA-230715]QWF81162.1 hypothetical protein HUW46_04588 [Amycolatopsis sp. CA-230715]
MRTPLALPFSGARLRELRERRGWYQAALAYHASTDALVIGQTTISRLESGDHRPSPPVLAALVAALGCEVDDLLDRETV